MKILGFDIGGTKCAVILATWNGEKIEIVRKEKCPTDFSISAEEMIKRLINKADAILDEPIDKIGISCGGPLDSARGVILSPPNLPGWDEVKISDLVEAHYGIRPILQNDANASAVAEWKFGAARGAKNAVFFTFGTGLGAGLILNGNLYEGTNGNAGEAGHIRLEKNGPIGYGKAGSFEGFCSGAGIAKLGYDMAMESIDKGIYPSFFPKGADKSVINAKAIADAAHDGDECAIAVYRTCGEYLGRGLSIIIDILNPEVIVIGGVFARSTDLIWPYAKLEIEKEALAPSVKCCRVIPAELGEQIGDYAAIATALL